MITVDGYSYGGKTFDRTEVIQSIQKELPTLKATIVLPFLGEKSKIDSFKNPMTYDEAISNGAKEVTYEYVEFNNWGPKTDRSQPGKYFTRTF